MKTIKDWFSFQFFSRSLLSARPFSFFHEEIGGDCNNQVMSTIPDHASNSAFNQETNVPVSSDMHFTSNSIDSVCNNRYPLSGVESLQVNFLRLLHRIGATSENIIVPQVLYRLQLADLIKTGESDEKRALHSIEEARVIAANKEACGETGPEFPLKILVLGKTGVGKSATINSIFNQRKQATCAFQPATDHIQEVVGTVKGMKITIIDTPGLLPSNINHGHNKKILSAVKRYIRKSPPDIVLYFERLDAFTKDYSDFPLLKLITNIFGASIWFNTILVMTHSSFIPEGSNRNPENYEAFVSQCRNLVQHYIHKAVADEQPANPVLLVENHHLCMTNREGEKILPNGVIWRYQFLLLCMASKILSDTCRLLKFQDSLQIGHASTRALSLPHFLSMLLHSQSLADSSDPDNEMGDILEKDDSEDDYDNLPPIRVLTKIQFNKLTKKQKNDYLDELDYRETLYLKKQLKEELKRRKESMSTSEESAESYHDDYNDASPDNVVPLTDLTIPLSFDSDNAVFRYRCMVNSDRCRFWPIRYSQCWDHDVGFDGVKLESSINFKNNMYGFVLGKMKKDKEEFNLQAECAAKYINHGRPVLCADINVQTAEKDLICTIRGDAKLKNLSRNTTGCSLSLTSFRGMYVGGAKVEDTLSLGDKLRLGMNVGCVGGCNEVAYGGGLEATIRGKDYPVRDDNVALALTLLSHDKDMVLGGSIKSDFRAGRGSKMSISANLNSRRLGQISLQTNTSEHIEIALLALISISRFIFGK